MRTGQAGATTLPCSTPAADEVVGKGTFYWEEPPPRFWVDPKRSRFVGMTQRMFCERQPPMNHFSRPTVYGALIDPQK